MEQTNDYRTGNFLWNFNEASIRVRTSSGLWDLSVDKASIAGQILNSLYEQKASDALETWATAQMANSTSVFDIKWLNDILKAIKSCVERHTDLFNPEINEKDALKDTAAMQTVKDAPTVN